MLDNVVEVNNLPLPQQREEIYKKRRHGMGFLGLGSALAMLTIPYGSEDSVEFTGELTKTMALESFRAGLSLAKEKGAAPIMNDTFEVLKDSKLYKKLQKFAPEFLKSKTEGDLASVPGRVLWANSPYMQKIKKLDPTLWHDLLIYGSRYSHATSIAPTGTIALSLANNASNGIEPSFSHEYFRNVIRDGKKSKERVAVNSLEFLMYKKFVDDESLPINKLPEYFTSSDKVTPKQHVDIQAAAQEWVDSSISKTINIPTDYPYDDFKQVYLYAVEKHLKGCTTFRFNPEAFQGVLVKQEDLENTTYVFTLEDGSEVELKGSDEVEYDGEMHTAANLYDAIKEGYYGKF
jgi:ribonucleoside-diphosphate reductase alpha chain